MVVDRIRVETELEQRMCSTCKKSSSEYYELKVQLRLLYFSDIYEMKKEITEKVDTQFTTVNKVEEKENGFDLYLRDHSEMGKMSSLFQKTYLCDEKRSKKLIGFDRQTSKKKYRYFISLWLVNLEKGDKVQVKGQNYSIKAINHNDLVLLEENSGGKEVLTYGVIKDYLKLIEKSEG